MLQLCFFRNPDESPRAATVVLDEIKTQVVLDLCVEARNVFVDNMDLIFGVSSDHAPLLLQRVAAENGRFALFDDQFVDLTLFGLQLSSLATAVESFSAAFPHIVHFLPFIHFSHTVAPLKRTLSTARL
jgi:hypothetical protein